MLKRKQDHHHHQPGWLGRQQWARANRCGHPLGRQQTGGAGFPTKPAALLATYR